MEAKEKLSKLLSTNQRELETLHKKACNTLSLLKNKETTLLSLLEQREKELFSILPPFLPSLFKNLSLQKEEDEDLLESLNFTLDLLHLLLKESPPSFLHLFQSPPFHFLPSRLSTLLSSFSPPPSHFPEFHVGKGEKKGEEGGEKEGNQKYLNFEEMIHLCYLRDYSSIKGPLRQIGSSGKGEMQFNFPLGMVRNERGDLYIADSKNHRIQCLDCEGKPLFHFGSKGKEEGQFLDPSHLAFDACNQRIFVADTLNHRIQVFGLDGSFHFSFGSEGFEDGHFRAPQGVAISLKGEVFVCDSLNQRVQVFQEDGSYLRKFGQMKDDAKTLKLPWAIEILFKGDMIVSDAGNGRLCLFNSNGELLRFIGEGRLGSPQWIFVDPLENFLVSDNGYPNKTIFIFSKEGEELHRICGGTMSWTFGVLMNPKGDLFVAGQAQADKQFRIFVF